MNRARYRFLVKTASALFLGRGDGSIDDLRLFQNQGFIATMARILPWYVLPELSYLGAVGALGLRRLYKRRYRYVVENEEKLIEHYYMITTHGFRVDTDVEKILSGSYLCVDWAELACIAGIKVGDKTLYKAVASSGIRKAGGTEVEVLERPWILVRRGSAEKRIIDIIESYEAASEALKRGGWQSREGWVRLPGSPAEVPHTAAAAFAVADMATSCRRWFEDKQGRYASYAAVWHFIARHVHAQRIFIRGIGLEPGAARIHPWGALVEKALSRLGPDETLLLMERAAISISEGLSSLVLHDIVVYASLHMHMLTGDDDMLITAAFSSAYDLSKAMERGYWVNQIPGAGSGPEALFLLGDRLVTADLGDYAKSIHENEEQLKSIMERLVEVSRGYVIRANTQWFGGCTRNRGVYRRECMLSNHRDAMKEAARRIRNIVGEPRLIA